MVATPAYRADPFPPPPEWVAARRSSQVLLTVKDVEAMVKAGVVQEDATTELLHGVLLYTDRAAQGFNPSMHIAATNGSNPVRPKGDQAVEGPDHNYAVSGLADWASVVNSPLRHLRTQSTLICSDTHAPVPDGVVLSGPRTDYRGRRPAAADAFCVIEVSDSSYERDTGEKLFGYARAGVVQYVVINLRNRTAEVYITPDTSAGTYAPPLIVGASESISIRVGNEEYFTVRLDQIFE
jgi:hypothetical protein